MGYELSFFSPFIWGVKIFTGNFQRCKIFASLKYMLTKAPKSRFALLISRQRKSFSFCLFPVL